jgi:hypothetical protein
MSRKADKMDEQLKEALEALRLAIDEAEGWYDESRGLNPGDRLYLLEPCYAVLEKHGLKRIRDEAESD